ncbi:MAG: hypothetical protein HOH19_04070 [Kordiimonadaceae bacterium]|jgi:hypothetical protein|nr:hypothetical protein [Kordiimonadaceae bacterium]MBT6031729.1 hypothetical protein [Kordiimonadaceae bacterium]
MVLIDFEEIIKNEIQNLGGPYVWTDIMLHGDHRVQKNVKRKSYRLLDAENKVIYRGDLERCRSTLLKLQIKFKSTHLILLIHGLGRHAGIMKKMRDALQNEGFSAHSLNYATLFEDVSTHADNFEYLIKNLPGVKKISFVTHSLGGLVARELLSRDDMWQNIKPEKIVMMGTPNKGAQIAEFLNRLKAFEIIMGPSSQNVLPDDKLKELPEPKIPTLIIAGGRGNNLGYNPLLPGDNDGIVTVDETRIDEPHEFICVPVIHTTIMDHKKSIAETINFLKT